MDLRYSIEQQRRHRGFARSGVVIAVMIVALAAWGLVSAHRARAQRQEAVDAQSVVTVATTTPQAASEAAEVTLPGSVQADYEAAIYARTAGYLKRWLVDIGTPVQAGQVLAEIDAPELDQQLRQAEADVATARANRDIADVTAERWRGLRDTDSVSKQEADEKISFAASTSAQLRSAEANVQRLREMYGFKKIVAPFAGVVTARNTDVGQLITAGSSSGPELFRIADKRRLRVYVHVPQTYAAAMKPGLVARVVFPDRPGKSYEATLERTSSALDVASRTLLAQLMIDNKQNELLPGAYAEVHFELPADQQSESLRVPANTLLFRNDGLRVATIDANGRVVTKPVIIGRDYGTELEIVQGLGKDDVLIINPPDSLTEQAKVRIARPAATPSPATS
jgi:RND family efflux transporter MFP subunit